MMTTLRLLSLWFMVHLLCAVPSVSAQTEPVLVVAIKETPPFATKRGESWDGISVVLWNRIAERMGLKTEFKEVAGLSEMLDAVASKEVGAAIGALTVTAEREENMDFSHGYFDSGLGIAVKAEGEQGLWALVGKVFSIGFVKAVGALLLVLLLAGTLMWVFERKRNEEEFGGSAQRGLGEGLWWAAVTMTTVGYGDRSPRTLGGRIIGLVWMFASILLISTFTASIASQLTLNQLEGKVQGPDDLAGSLVGAVDGSIGASWLEGRGIAPSLFTTTEEALDALHEGRVDAIVHDAPLLRYFSKTLHPKLQILPHRLDRQNYAFALIADSPLKEKLNRELLALTAESSWSDTLRRFLGE